MKIKTIILAVTLMLGSAAQAQSLGDLLGGLGKGSDSSTGSTLQNIVEGIFTKSDLEVKDLAGTYTSTAPAVAFKSDNFLQKAGGIAASAALESKLAPYFKQYGLTGGSLAIDEEGAFKMTVKRIPISGTITPGSEKGTFTFQIKAASVKIGQFTAYVEKSGKNLDLMFDAKKLKDLISTIGGMTGSKLTSTVSKLLDSYDGCYIGFKMEYTGEAPASSSANGASSATAAGDSAKTTSPVKGLFDLLNKKN